MLNRHKHNPVIVRLILVAFSISVLAAPDTLKATSLTLSTSAAASLAPGQSLCAPQLRCCCSSFEECWYDLLNNESFGGTSCTPNWVFQNGYQPSFGRVCTTDALPRDAYFVVFPNAGQFYQNFSVPSGLTKPLRVTVRFQAVGGATWWDRIILQLYEGNTQLWITRIPAYSIHCEKEVFTLLSSYAGKNLRLVVSPSISTPGAGFHINSIQISAFL